MATLKICTLKQKRWITDIQEIVVEEMFSVTHFDDPFQDCAAPHATVKGQNVRSTIVVDFQEPRPEDNVLGDDCGQVLLVRRQGEHDFAFRVVAPQRSCFLMSDTGKTIDRF